MKTLASTLLLALALLLGPSFNARAADDADGDFVPTTPAEIDLRALIDDFTEREAGPELADELFAAIDALLAKYEGDRSNGVAQVVVFKAMMTLQIRDDIPGARELLESVARDYPDTETASYVPQTIASLDAFAAQQDSLENPQQGDSLVGQPAPELNFLWSSKSGIKKLSDLRGQVVVIDFWATWCGPCIRSFPDIAKEVQRFEGAPVTFLGVTSLQGAVHGLQRNPIDTKNNPQREMALMPEFMKKFKMTWDVAFSKEEVFNDDYGVEGIPHMAIIAPDGTLRYRGLHPSDPHSDIAGKIVELLDEFDLWGGGPQS